MDRTSEIESAVAANAARIREYDDEFGIIKSAVGRHDKAFSGLKAIKDDFSKTKSEAVSQMNNLIATQKEQVDRSTQILKNFLRIL